MLNYLDSLTGTPEINTDICVIGAGAAGIVFAKEFIGSNTRLTLLESGSLILDADTQAMNQGDISGLDYPPLETSRLRFFGGTTNHWAGQSTPLEPIDFARRDWVPDSGWPISYEEFSRFLPRAQEACKLGDASFAWEEWKPHLENPLEDSDFSPVIIRYPNPITRFGQAYRADIENADNINCIFGANATNIVADQNGNVDFVEARSLSGTSIIIRASHFVLACGAMLNVKLLLNSGIGNVNQQVGKYFMEHPNFDTGEIQLDDNERYPMLTEPRSTANGSEIRSDHQLSEDLQERLGILNHSVFLVEKPYGPYTDNFAGRLVQLWNRVERRIDRYLDTRPLSLRVRLEQAPLADSKLSLSNQQDALGLNNINMDLKFSGLEGRTISEVQKEFARVLGARSLGRMKLDFDESETEWMNRVGWQSHHLGGTRMSQDPDNGVVDINCKMHELNNLYIASSSVFPTGGHANPTMNLIALTLRLADHLKTLPNA